MAPHIRLLLSALVAHHQSRIITAAPLSSGTQVQKVIWMTVTSTASMEEMVTSTVPAFYSSDDIASTTSPPKSTVTQWDTITVTARPTETSDPVTTATPTKWTMPESFEDLSGFGIKKLAYGSTNVAVVTGIPASASASSAEPSAVSVGQPSPITPPLPRLWVNSSVAYRIFYPSGSINPGNRPQGGAEFYATPGDLSFEKANNVTLEYSVFFPADFEWVQGGKLPGLYGGHEGCSGGNDAKSCFSTRLMWRKEGAGELYLYAPKDKQTTELCNAPPQSVCDAAYGLSVGRGSFHFGAGSWTHVSQTVRLNTPGQQDGGFELFVNGQQIMRRDDVFYRDIPQSRDGECDVNAGGCEDGIPRGTQQPEGDYQPDPTPDGILPLLPVLRILENELFARDGILFDPDPLPIGVQDDQKRMGMPPTTDAAAQIYFMPASDSSESESDDAVGFSGLFFSTFFGGHEESWASPKDQYTWFKDFGMSINK